MNPHRNFWRLFGDYERLTRDEATAIWEWHFDALTAIHEKKLLILAELIRIARMIGLNRDNPALNSRLSIVGEAEQHNVELVDHEISKNRIEFKLLHTASMRLRAVEHVYAPYPHRKSLEGTFCAQV